MKKYDIVFDDGDVETDIDEIMVAKVADYQTCLEKPEEGGWIGVTNFRVPDSKDDYARLIGWYVTSLGEAKREVYTSLGDALRAHDKVSEPIFPTPVDLES